MEKPPSNDGQKSCQTVTASKKSCCQACQTDLQTNTRMNEVELIKSAFEEQIKSTFNIFFDAYTTAQNDQAKSEAEERFKKGILNARAIRDRALAILP